ncbi:MAG: prepilin-type N-terminal cleavage/methylation domain-containing protein [Fimbriimonas sp.]|nr:prepilin-type N-terminal cleavage/methylation domain-containing protein [Fimbriimonas sp.]
MNQKAGFTLIELLVVIAIIAILAGIIFPVFSQVRASAYRSSDMSNMNAIRSALQLYRQDQGGYPPALLGYVTQYGGGPNPTEADMVPANQVVGALYPKRIDSLTTLQPAYDRITAGQQFAQFTPAVWPNKAPGGGSAYNNAPQRYGPTDISILGDANVIRCFNPNDGVTVPYDVENQYYKISGFDVATVPNENGNGTRNEIHYAPFWSQFTVAADPCHPVAGETGSALDDPRQLGYSDPPESTVVTWDSYFRDYSGGALQENKMDIVLFLGGSARAYDSVLVNTMSWKVGP